MATILKKVRARWTREAAAGGAITPGHMLQYSGADTVVVHGTPAVTPPGMLVALEDPLSGGGTTTPYTAGQRVVLQALLPGEEFEAIASAAIAANAGLESTGDGRLRTLAAGVRIGRAITAAAGANSRFIAMAE